MARVPDANSTVAAPAPYARTPQQALNYTRLIAASLTMIAFLLSFVVWVMLGDEPPPPPSMSPLEPFSLILLAIGVAVAGASAFISRQLGRVAARNWASSGRRGDQAAVSDPSATATVFGLDIGPTSAATAATTVWDRFLSISVVGAAMPEVVLLMGFVVTILTYQWVVMAGSVVVYLVFWSINFPRRSHWDDWAESAGLALPWDR